VGRGLFQGLQEGVPRGVREHVDLVHDVDLVAIAGGAEGQALLQLPHLVDAVVAGAVDLLDVEVVALGNFCARRAHLAGRGGRARGLAVCAEAVEALGQQAGAGGLADPADAGEQEGMGHAVLGDGTGEGTGNVLLPREVLEGLRTVLSGQDDVTHAHSLRPDPFL